MFAHTFNRNKPPISLKRKTTINIEKPKFFQMKNGLKVIIVENHKLPLVRVGLELDCNPSLEKDKAGIKKILGQMLRSGTKNRTKEELDEIIDYMGCSLYTSFSEVSIFTMKKYLSKSVSIMSDILMNSKFDNSKELDKIIKQRIIDINLAEKDPNSILQRVRNILYFGKSHPYGEYETYDTIKNITLHDIKKLYEKYYVPNISYLSFIGDISQKEAEKLCNIYFSKWEKKSYTDDLVTKEYMITSEIEIDIVDVPSLSQSTICFGGPVSLRKNDSEYFPSILANGILGGGPQSRLFLNLREKKAYTYGAYSILKSDKNIGYFSVYTQVRNEVTEKAIKDIIKEIKEITTAKKISLEELKIKKKEISGQFILDFEDPNRISDLFICELKNNLPDGFYKNYLNKIESVKIGDVHQSCRKFFFPKNGRIIIIGKASDILPNLKKLGYPIRYFDQFGSLINKDE
ncbi:M16 family metallopeptidase [Blattabacterium cuenoti]|uniref:M16 family metallopeptidase n=1 Tax=Blattabacterium cuenoti TaxID=1653831 RepID=UPI001EEC7231|nr:pitrilysin family protein [Blattabacterium cuenoti]